MIHITIYTLSFDQNSPQVHNKCLEKIIVNMNMNGHCIGANMDGIT